MALANINAAKQWRGQPEVMRYGPHEDDEVNGRKEWRLDPNTIEIGLRIIAMRKSAQCFGYFAAMVGRRQGTLEEAGSPRAADRDHPGLLQ